MTTPEHVIRHYGEHDLRDRLDAALTEAGLAGKTLSPRDLAPLDQFHTRGLAATLELAVAAGVAPDMEVLDIGAGLGGPSRFLAATYGCRVHGIDLSTAFVGAARFLAERSGLAARVSYECANALALPFAAERFDIAWTQHVAMNIADRKGLYAEAFRVLKPGGRLALYDVTAGDGTPLHFPVPWSRTADTSFLLSAAAMRAELERQGFRILTWEDRTEAAVAWFAERQKAAPSPAPALGLHIAMGPEFGAMTANLGRNLREGRAGIIQAVVERG